MKNLKEIIQEKLKINSKSKIETQYHPKNKVELKELIEKLLKERGESADLNDIDTSKITDMSYLFTFNRKNFKGDISQWDVSNVTDMKWMFTDSSFNGDISQWDVSNVKDMYNMFNNCKKFNLDLSEWDVSNVEDMHDMFYNCPLEKNPPKWYRE